jgi:uncharacterized radical SAM superfamily Fe-S cluster-containing enzyme
MSALYIETKSLCPDCAMDVPAYYEERPDGMYLHLDCPDHGHSADKVENDAAFFRSMYEQEYESRAGHLVLPVTYSCNLSCRYCYTLSNSGLESPDDRPLDWIVRYSASFGKSTNLIGGEPTVREDLPDIISQIKSIDNSHILSISTNGQRLKEPAYVRMLKERGLDYVFLSLNDVSYEETPVIYKNKLVALDNCLKAGLPVWLQRTVDSIGQINSILDIIRKYRKTLFQVSIRSVKPYGKLYPGREVYVSDMLRHLGKENEYSKGSTPFNCHVRLSGVKTKLCSWVSDVRRLDPIDFAYVIANDELTTFHRGMRKDEFLIKTGGWKKADRFAGRPA